MSRIKRGLSKNPEKRFLGMAFALPHTAEAEFVRYWLMAGKQQTMDPLTHMLAGAAVADALSAPGRLGRAALPSAMILAALPDVDVLPALVAAFPRNPFSTQGLFDADVMREIHRGYTHALPILMVAGLAAAAVLWRFAGKKGGWFGWPAVCLAALFSHPVLDMANGAVQALHPFSSGWYGWGQSPEADPVLLAVLAVSLLANHPPRFKNTRNLGTLRLLEGVGGRLHRFLHARASARGIALAALLVATLTILFRLFW